MSQAFIASPLGTLEIIGDINGISVVTFRDEKIPQSEKIPEALKTAVLQLQEYFEGNRTHFDLKLNPQGTDFQKRVWEELSQILC